jgi:Terminase small subunit
MMTAQRRKPPGLISAWRAAGLALTPKQARFVEEYQVDLNGTQAALRAGYSHKTADQQASRLLTNVKVQEALQAAITARSQRTEIKADWVIGELAKIDLQGVSAAPEGCQLQPRRGAPEDAGGSPHLTRPNLAPLPSAAIPRSSPGRGGVGGGQGIVDGVISCTQTNSAAIRLISHKIPLFGRKNSAVRQRSGITSEWLTTLRLARLGR